MLRFFNTRHDLPEIQTKNASPFKILNADEFTNKVIPFSHIYITSNHYLQQIKHNLGKDLQQSIIELNPYQRSTLLKHAKFPQDLSAISINSITDFHNLLPGLVG